MPIYEFKCAVHGVFQDWRELGDTTPPPCPQCDTPMTRKYSLFAPKMGMQAHFNVALGRYVESEADLKDGFKTLSEQQSEKDGITRSFIPVDPREAKTELGVTDEGLDATYAKMRDEGVTEAKTQWL